MADYRAILKRLLAAIDEAPSPDDRCVVCLTETAEHGEGCAYAAAEASIESEPAMLARVERMVARVMALGDVADDVLVDALQPLKLATRAPEFRDVRRAVVASSWWSAMVKQHGDRIIALMRDKPAV